LSDEKKIDKFFDIYFFIKLYSKKMIASKRALYLEKNSNGNQGEADEDEDGVVRCKDKFSLENIILPDYDNQKESKLPN
jgi:hypothetical protein